MIYLVPINIVTVIIYERKLCNHIGIDNAEFRDVSYNVEVSNRLFSFQNADFEVEPNTKVEAIAVVSADFPSW